jgi:hypothetical protein
MNLIKFKNQTSPLFSFQMLPFIKYIIIINKNDYRVKFKIFHYNDKLI